MGWFIQKFNIILQKDAIHNFGGRHYFVNTDASINFITRMITLITKNCFFNKYFNQTSTSICNPYKIMAATATHDFNKRTARQPSKKEMQEETTSSL